MKKYLPVALLSICASTVALSFPSAAPASEYVEVEITNPCTRNVGYGYNSHTLKPEVNVDNYGSVDAGKSKKITVPKGVYLKFERKNQSCSTMLGRVDYKGQRFTMDCQ